MSVKFQFQLSSYIHLSFLEKANTHAVKNFLRGLNSTQHDIAQVAFTLYAN